MSKLSTKHDPTDEIHWKHHFTKTAGTQWEAEKSRDTKALLNKSWGDGTMAPISDWRSQTSQGLRTTSKGNVAEGSTFITNRFKFTRGRMAPPMENRSGTSSRWLLHCCFPRFYSLVLPLENQGHSPSAAVSPTMETHCTQAFPAQFQLFVCLFFKWKTVLDSKDQL